MTSKQKAKNEFKRISQKVCPVCNSKQQTELFSSYDDRYGQPDEYQVAKCKKCTAYYLTNPISNDNLSKLYEKYYPSLDHFPSEDSTTRKFLKRLPLFKLLKKIDATETLISKVPSEKKVLDVGCGYYPGMKDEIHKQKIHWEGLEIDPKLVSVIQQQGLTCHQGDLLTFRGKKKYDYVLLSQVVEHQAELSKSVIRIREILRPGGKVLLLTPNSDSLSKLNNKQEWIHWHVPYHTVIFNKKSIQTLANIKGFRVNKYFTYTPTHWQLLQDNYHQPKKGKKNLTFKYSFSPLRYLFMSLKLRLTDRISEYENPCMYCELELLSS